MLVAQFNYVDELYQTYCRYINSPEYYVGRECGGQLTPVTPVTCY